MRLPLNVQPHQNLLIVNGNVSSWTVEVRNCLTLSTCLRVTLFRAADIVECVLDRVPPSDGRQATWSLPTSDHVAASILSLVRCPPSCSPPWPHAAAVGLGRWHTPLAYRAPLRSLGVSDHFQHQICTRPLMPVLSLLLSQLKICSLSATLSRHRVLCSPFPFLNIFMKRNPIKSDNNNNAACS